MKASLTCANASLLPLKLTYYKKEQQIMNRTNQTNKKRIKDTYFQVSESFFEKSEAYYLMGHYGFKGIGIYLKISLILLKNQGTLPYDWKMISSKPSDKVIIEDIITKSGFFTLSKDGTSYSSDIVTDQLTERGKISMDQSIKASKRWEKSKGKTTKQTIGNTNSIEDADMDINPKFKKASQEKWDEIELDDDLDLDA
jgi:hypothetical protein